MSFWDMEGDDSDDNSLDSIINNPSSTIFDVLKHELLFQEYRMGEPHLIEYLTQQNIIKQLIDIIFRQNDIKMAKSVMQLFAKPDSPVFVKFISTYDYIIGICKDYAKLSLVQIGYLSSILISAMSATNKTNILELLCKEQVITTLIQHIEQISIQEFFIKYFELIPEEHQWLHILFLSLVTQNLAINSEIHQTKIKNIILNLKIILSKTQEISVMKIIYEYVSKYPVDSEKLKVFQENVHLLPAYPISYQIAAKLPLNDKIFKRACGDSISPMHNQNSVEALIYLSKFPTIDLLESFPALLNNFVSDRTNSFHLAAFTDLIQSLYDKIPEFSKFVPQISEKILSVINSNTLRKQSGYIVYYLKIAYIIDSACTSPEWINFRQNVLSQWIEVFTDSYSAADGLSITSAPQMSQFSNKSIDNIDEAPKPAPKEEKKEEFHFAESVPPKEEKKEEFGGFFTADSGKSEEFKFPDSIPPKEEKQEDFGGFFTDVDTGKNEEFKFPDSIPQKEEKSDNLGGFFDNTDKDDFKFPDSIPTSNEAENFGGFFDEVDEQPNKEEKQKDEFKFPDSIPKEEKKESDNLDGFFDNTDEVKFPDSIPKEEKASNENLGGFFDDVDKDEIKSPESIPKEEKKESDNLGGFFGNTEEITFPDSIPKEEKKESENLGGFFDNVDKEEITFPESIPKEEKKESENLGGFFGNTEEIKFPDSIPKEEKKESDNLGGFFGNTEEITFPDSIPKEEKKESENLGGFFDNVDKEEIKFPDSIPKEEKKESDNLGGFFGNTEEIKFPDSIPKEEKASNENLGGFFNDVDKEEIKFPDSIPKEEEKGEQNIGGFFGNVNNEEFVVPDSVPNKQEKEDLGGFFDEVDFNENPKTDYKIPGSSSEEKIEHNFDINLKNSVQTEDKQPAKEEKQPIQKKEDKTQKDPEVVIPTFGEEVKFPTSDEKIEQKPKTTAKTDAPKGKKSNNDSKLKQKEKKQDDDDDLGIVADEAAIAKQTIEPLEDYEEDEDIYAEAVIPEKPVEKKDDAFDPFASVEFPVDFPDDFSSTQVESDEEIAKKIFDLLQDKTWEVTWNTTAEFFAHENRFESEDKAFAFLTSQTKI